MKTALQKLIDRWEKGKDSSVPSHGLIFQKFINEAKEMLEEEKEQISDAYVVGYADADNGFYFNDDYYNETFNTKEK
jgi:hypothetical protein